VVLCFYIPFKGTWQRGIFWGFCINGFGIGTLHYISNRSDFDFEFAEIFVIEKRLPTRRLSDSLSFPLKHSKADSPTRRVGKSSTPRLTESESRRLLDSASRGVVFQLRISPRIRSQNRNGSKSSVRDLWGTDFCKNPRKSASLPCPFKETLWTPQPF
jgi:hypothetical protein